VDCRGEPSEVEIIEVAAGSAFAFDDLVHLMVFQVVIAAETSPSAAACMLWQSSV
jgi:hypothetical protein